MLNVGMSEGLLLLVLGLIFLKPDQFSQTARWLGRQLREARKMGKTFSQSLLQDTDLKDFREAAKTVQEAVSAGKKVIRDAAGPENAINATPVDSSAKKKSTSSSVVSAGPAAHPPEKRSVELPSAAPAASLSAASDPPAGPNPQPGSSTTPNPTSDKSDV